jgi:hypothetical protein
MLGRYEKGQTPEKQDESTTIRFILNAYSGSLEKIEEQQKFNISPEDT